MKVLNKKIPMGIALAVWFVSATLVYSLGYKTAMDKLNSVVSYIQERQKMYSTLSELDYNVRLDYTADIDEADLIDGLCKGYISGLKDGNCKFFSKQEYKEYCENHKEIPADIEMIKINNDLICLKCGSLTNGASKIFIDDLEEASSEGATKAIVDLRNCSSGDVNEVFRILQYLMPPGDIVNCVDKKGSKEVVCKSTSPSSDFKIVALINNKTSGAAEVLASSFKDKGDITIIGTQTPGNTSRVKTVNLSDDSVLTFSDAHYITQSGAVIFKKGIKPDVISQLSEESEKLLASKNLSRNDDNQFQEATKLIDSLNGEDDA